ncbi:MAG: preprotein translocase subunit YajC [Planctomycetota bacterium]|jgi:preprotein translocase subunit YajC|nr:preprotein translocase subunit YajC [Planctomycetota bacterium]MDP7253532.1 preprotein translocase subunit YajC [Planctomycetota bacterium]
MDTVLNASHYVIFMQQQQQTGGGEVFAQMLPMIVILFVFMYLFAIRPQRKQEKEKKKLLESIQKNDRVVTIGGLHGTVSSLKEDTVLVSVADGVQLKFAKSAIQTVRKGKRDSEEGEEGSGKD